MGPVHVSASHNLIEYGLDKQAGSIEFSRNKESWQNWYFCTLLKFENKMNGEISHFIINNCKSALKL